jgi:hypothetical protein
MLVLWTLSGSAQTQPEGANPCAPPPQQTASANPPPAVPPVKPEEHGEQLPPPYQKLNVRQKFDVFVRHTYSPYTLAGAGFDALLAQASGAWYPYGGGMEGYGKRYGASLADTESGVFFGRFLFPELLRQDPRYLRSTSEGVLPRAEYALSRIVVTHNDSGRKSANFSLILSAFAASGLANTYYPRIDRGFGDTMARAGGGLVSTAGMNVLREFWPDIMSKIRKHSPERMKKLEESPRVEKIEQMVVGPTASPCPAPANHNAESGSR